MVKGKELNVFCAWGTLPMQFISLLKTGWEEIKEVNSISLSDLVIFTGGADVSPHLYNREMMGAEGCNADRDKIELVVYEQAVKKRIPIFGVCRGLI